ncbi:MAG: hypothetical protein WAT19_03035 [Ferruginibacter sp.]
MQHCKYLIVLFLLLSTKLFAQETDITGLWKGTLYNDSTKRTYKYELGISDEKGKLSGFSHTWFILNDTQYFGVKYVKIKRRDGKIIVEDDGLISNNYPVAPAKNIKQLNILTLEIKDSILRLTGPFTTNRTKDWAPITGSIELQRKNDFWQSSLVPHLQELGMDEKLVFVKEEKEQKRAIAAKEQEETAPTDNKRKEQELMVQKEKQEKELARAIADQKAKEENETARKQKEADALAKKIAAEKEAEEKALAKADAERKDKEAREELRKLKEAENLAKKQAEENEKQEKALAKLNEAERKKAAAEILRKQKEAEIAAKKQAEEKEKTEKALAKAEAERKKAEEKEAAQKQKEADALAKKQAEEKERLEKIAAAEKAKQETEEAKQFAIRKQREAEEEAARKKLMVAADLDKRKTELQQTVSFSADSLQLSLYDNGEVDGDTVTVLMNGKVIIAKAGLSTRSINKTIYIEPGTDSIQLVMYAENLGRIAPNTGLLVVRDGKEMHEVRFSGDLARNAAVVFRRRK